MSKQDNLFSQNETMKNQRTIKDTDDLSVAWNKAAEQTFLNRKIVGTRYMTRAEADAIGWHSRAVVLMLDDGTLLYPSTDDEGNGPGALFTTHKEHNTFPLLPCW
jgi:hypothetical protein